MYEDRLVVFLDILGFKNIVQRSINNENLVGLIKSVAEFNIKLQFATFASNKGINNEFPYGIQVTVFSDSIVISCPVLSGGIGYFLLCVASHCLAINRLGFFVRGGITYGKLYHNGNVCFGPAMNRAYELESHLAIYPRVLIDASTFGYLVSNISEELLHEEFSVLFNYGIEDSIHYWLQLDYLSSSSLYQDDSIIQFEDMETIREHIISAISDNTGNDRVEVKYCWFMDYFNKSVQRSKLLSEEQKNTLFINRSDLSSSQEGNNHE